jgi:hypothetical protein
VTWLSKFFVFRYLSNVFLRGYEHHISGSIAPTTLKPNELRRRTSTSQTNESAANKRVPLQRSATPVVAPCHTISHHLDNGLMCIYFRLPMCTIINPMPWLKYCPKKGLLYTLVGLKYTLVRCPDWYQQIEIDTLYV